MSNPSREALLSSQHDETYFDAKHGVAPLPVVVRMKMNFTQNFNSTAAFVIQNQYDTQPNTVVEWTSLALIYQAYRTRRLTLKFVPDNRYSKATTLCTAGMVVSDYTGATGSLTSMALAANYVDDLTFCSLEDPWEHTLVLPMVAPYSEWIPTSTPVVVATIKSFFNGLSASSTYGTVILTYDVEFLGRF